MGNNDHAAALALKGAGYPQQGSWGIVHLPEKQTLTKGGGTFTRREEYRVFPWKMASSFLTGGYEPLVLPTVGELMDQLGKYICLLQEPEGWVAWRSDVKFPNAGGKGIGTADVTSSSAPTAQDALAKLYITESMLPKFNV